jgi:hypothetical protein
MSPDTPDRDGERDAWLDAALRHAPDAGVGPPAAVREAILREARAASMQASGRAAPGTRARASGGIGAVLGAFWDWLARPPVAAGFASILVATVIGVMWWDRPLDATLERPALTAAAPATRSSSSNAALAAPPAPETREESQLSALGAQPPALASPVPTPEQLAAAQQSATMAAVDASRLRGQAGAPKEEARRESSASAKIAAAPAVTEDRLARAPAAAAPAAKAEAPPRAPVPDTGLDKSRRAMVPAGEGPAANEVRGADTRGPQASEGTLARRSKDAPEPFPSASAGAVQAMPSDRAAERFAQRDERGAADANALRPSRIAPAAPPAAGAMRAPLLASLRDRIAAEPGRWSWSRDDGAPRAAADDLMAWLARADASTRSASLRTDADALGRSGSEAGAGTPAEPPTMLRLYRDGQLQASLRVDATGLEATDVAGAVQRVPLAAPDRAALRSALPR